MKIAVFGATGGIGRHVVEQALSAGHDVRALARQEGRVDPSERVVVVIGDIADGEAVARVVEGADGVIWAVGATRNSPDQVDTFERGARNVIAAMDHHAVRRLVGLSGAGITIERERKPLAGRLMSSLVALLVKHVVEAKRREYEVFSRSNTEWTLVRPPRVVEGAPTANYVVGNRLAGRSVTQGDLAEFMVRELVEGNWVAAAPYISS